MSSSPLLCMMHSKARNNNFPSQKSARFKSVMTFSKSYSYGVSPRPGQSLEHPSFYHFHNLHRPYQEHKASRRQRPLAPPKRCSAFPGALFCFLYQRYFWIWERKERASSISVTLLQLSRLHILTQLQTYWRPPRILGLIVRIYDKKYAYLHIHLLYMYIHTYVHIYVCIHKHALLQRIQWTMQDMYTWHCAAICGQRVVFFLLFFFFFFPFPYNTNQTIRISSRSQESLLVHRGTCRMAWALQQLSCMLLQG